jgi:hypothetical protein
VTVIDQVGNRITFAEADQPTKAGSAPSTT